MTASPNLTSEQKEQNKNYVLANIDKYILDSRGNFYSLDLELVNDERYFIGKEAVNDYEKIKEGVTLLEDSVVGFYRKRRLDKLVDKIIQEKENWEIIYSSTESPKIFKNRKTGEELEVIFFDWYQYYVLLGELGYRENIWENYKTDEDNVKKNWEEERERDKNQSQNPSSSSSQPTPANNPQEELANQKQQINQQIIIALNQEPKLSDSELSANYQNWVEQIEKITDLNQLNTLKEQILTDIQVKRAAKQAVAQEINDNLAKAQTGTTEQKAQALENLAKKEGELVYEAQKAAITEIKVAQATENTTAYQEKLVQKLTNKLTEQGVSETELSTQTKTGYNQLKSGAITDPTQLVTIENNITKNIYQVKVTKELANLITETNTMLNSSNKDQIAQLKNKLLAFINNTNIYYTKIHKEEAKQQLAKLESYVVINHNPNNNNLSLPTKLVIGGGVSLIALGIILVLRKRKKISICKIN